MPAVGFLALLLFLLFLSLLWEEKLPPLTSLHYRENQRKSWLSVFLLPDFPISYFSTLQGKRFRQNQKFLSKRNGPEETLTGQGK